MTDGILEQIRDAIMANTAAINAHASLASGGGAAALTAHVAASPLGSTGLLSAPQMAITAIAAAPPAVTDTGQPITSDALAALIQPHVANEAIKAALGVAMRDMGIGAFPETAPHQYNALYAAFKGVLARFGIGGAVAAAAPAASASII